MDNTELLRDLSKMIRGELSSADVKRIVHREGFQSLSELCETRLPEDLGKIRIGLRDLITRIDRARRKQIDLYELWYWADELYNISFNHRIAYEARAEELITTALSAVSVVANQRFFRQDGKTARALEYLRTCLVRRRRISLARIFSRIFEDLDVANLAVRPPSHEEEPPGEDESATDAGRAGPRWADVVLLDRPFAEGKSVYSDYSWVIAFTITSRSLHEEERAEDAAIESGFRDDAALEEWVCPECEARREAKEAEAAAEGADGLDLGERAPGFEEPRWREGDGAEEPAEKVTGRARLRPPPRDDGAVVDRVPALRRLVPNFDFARYRPLYLHDGDGIAEIVLDVETIGPVEVRYATRLFCLANRIRCAQLGGEAVKTLVVRPGTGRRREPGRRSEPASG